MWHFFCFWGTECDRDLGRGGGGRQAGGTFPTSWRSFSQCGEWQSGFLVLASGFSLAPARCSMRTCRSVPTKMAAFPLERTHHSSEMECGQSEIASFNASLQETRACSSLARTWETPRNLTFFWPCACSLCYQSCLGRYRPTGSGFSSSASFIRFVFFACGPLYSVIFASELSAVLRLDLWV